MRPTGSHQQKRSELLFSARVDTSRATARKKAIRFVSESISRDRGAGVVLEVGCGSNPIGVELANNDSFVGIDLSLSLLQVAHTRDCTKHRCEFLVADAEYLPFRSSAFAASVCVNVLHHFPDPRPVAVELRRVLRASGKLIIVEPNGSNPVTRLTRSLSSLLPKKFVAMKGIATPNERVHTLRTYHTLFTSMGFLLARLISSYERQPQTPARYVLNSRLFLFDFIWLVLPQPLNGNEAFLEYRLIELVPEPRFSSASSNNDKDHKGTAASREVSRTRK